MIEIRETDHFRRVTKKLLTQGDRESIALILSLAPESGDIIRDSGGLRKMRYALPGRGKSSGVRVIYYYMTTDGMVYLITAYAKNVKENITPDDLRLYKKMLRLIKEDGHA